MERIENDEDLQTAIFMLEARKENELRILKKQLREVSECLKPINIIKNTIKDAVSSPELQGNLIGSAIGMGTGFIAKKLIVGSSGGFIKKIIGTIVQKIVARKVSNNVGGVKSAGTSILQKIFSKPEPSPETS
jgi:hypothetical protein